jgi:5'-3' exonuclease
MGVPGLFSYIKTTFPGVVRTIRRNDSTQVVQTCDRLYIDTNALIHPCAQTVFNYGSGKKLVDLLARFSFEERMEKLLDLVVATITGLVVMFPPKKSVMIAVDGCAPFAKQTQQRQRRYVAARDRPSEGRGVFDSNCISPGTKFMFELHLRLKKLSHTLAKRFPSLEVVYSSYMTPGEGEHKLLDRIRSSVWDTSYTTNDEYCIIGPDGDLLILGLSLPVKHLTIARQDLGQNSDPFVWYLVNVSQLKHSLAGSWHLSSVSATTFEERCTLQTKYLTEFTLVCSVFGNDFLPRIQMFVCLSQGLEMILKTWEEIHTDNQQQRESGLGSPGVELYDPIPVLKNLFTSLAAYEPSFLWMQREEETDHSKFVHTTLFNHSTDTEFDFVGYRHSYYAKAGITTQEAIDQVCHEYITTLIWIYRYYIFGLPEASWTWRYPRFYPPLMYDLSNVIHTYRPSEFTLGEPVPPFLQLLLVLPPKSKGLLPVRYQQLMTGSEFGSEFPTSFELDGEGKRYDHEMIVKLKLPNVDVVSAAYHAINKQDPNHWVRNEIVEEFVYLVE